LLVGLGLAAAQAPVELTRVTTTSDGAFGVFRNSGAASLSDDGTKLAFVSASDFLAQGIPEGQWEIWMYDTASGHIH